MGPPRNFSKSAPLGDKERVIKEGEVLAICARVPCITRTLQATITESSDTLISEILQSAELSPDQRSAAERLLVEFKDLFSRTSGDVGRTKVTQHRIDTGNHFPIKQHPRRLPFAKQEEMSMIYDASSSLLTKMQQNDIILLQSLSHRILGNTYRTSLEE